MGEEALSRCGACPAWQELVNLVLGLWGYALLDLANTDVKPLKEKVLRNKIRVFPPKYFKGLVCSSHIPRNSRLRLSR